MAGEEERWANCIALSCLQLFCLPDVSQDSDCRCLCPRGGGVPDGPFNSLFCPLNILGIEEKLRIFYMAGSHHSNHWSSVISVISTCSSFSSQRKEGVECTRGCSCSRGFQHVAGSPKLCCQDWENAAVWEPNHTGAFQFTQMIVSLKL